MQIRVYNKNASTVYTYSLFNFSALLNLRILYKIALQSEFTLTLGMYPMPDNITKILSTKEASNSVG